ncbi:MAG: monoamine oxidase [Cyclobacteriaceae bacterium]
MKHRKYKYLIIGAGLSGLTAGYQLSKSGEEDYLILEARDRIGGRILTDNQIDMGATWFQGHHTVLASLLLELGISSFGQYRKGQSVLVYSTMAPAHHFESDQSSEPAKRISGGSAALINRLVGYSNGKVLLNAPVDQITKNENAIEIKTSDGLISADYVMIAFPPRLASLMVFDPPLPSALTQVMSSTHTWMSNAIKIGLTFEHPFWRENGLSGMVIGQTGPVVELYDHTDHEEQTFSLMGFINEALRKESFSNRQERILNFLAAQLGPEVRSYTSYQEKDWSQDPHTADANLDSIYMSPQYGNPIFDEAYWGSRLFLSGAETALVHGGYMDGAVRSGIQTVERMLKASTANPQSI